MKRYILQAYRELPGTHADGEWETIGQSNTPIRALFWQIWKRTSRSRVAHRILHRDGRTLVTFKYGDDGRLVITAIDLLLIHLTRARARAEPESEE